MMGSNEALKDTSCHLNDSTKPNELWSPLQWWVIQGFASNLTGDVHEAAQIITEFDNTRFFTRPKLAGVRANYRFGK